MPSFPGSGEAMMGRNGERIGTVGALWRYPVQSMRGEALTETEVAASGICGDRAFGIVDPEIGKAVTSAGGKRKWRDLVTYAARFATPPKPDAPRSEEHTSELQ